MLYLSLYFKTHREAYYNHLQVVRDSGDWEEWIRFFLNGVSETANQAFQTGKRILKIFTEDRQKIEREGRSSASILIIHHYLQKHPITDAKYIVNHCNITLPTVNKSLAYLADQGIIQEITGKARNKVYVYKEYLDVLNEGAAPIK